MAVTHQLEGGLTSCGGELVLTSVAASLAHQLWRRAWSALIMQHRPVVADTTKWCNVSIKDAQITIKGGFNTKGELAEPIR